MSELMQPEQVVNTFEKMSVGLTNGLVGLDDKAGQLVLAWAAGSNALLEGPPGIGKTQIVNNAEQFVVSSSDEQVVGRHQGTPDSLPSSIIGKEIVNLETGKLEISFGPAMSHIVFLDELNRNSPKTQNAVNQLASEGTITIEGKTFFVPSPQIVIATQNPHAIGEATSHMTSALADRFVSIDFEEPSASTKLLIAMQHSNRASMRTTKEVEAREERFELARLSTDEIANLQRYVGTIVLEQDAAVFLIQTEDRLKRDPQLTLISGSETAGLGTRYIYDAVNMAKAHAAKAGKLTATQENMEAVIPMVLAHRITAIDHNPMAPKADKHQAVADAIKAAKPAKR